MLNMKLINLLPSTLLSAVDTMRTIESRRAKLANTASLLLYLAIIILLLVNYLCFLVLFLLFVGIFIGKINSLKINFLARKRPN